MAVTLATIAGILAGVIATLLTTRRPRRNPDIVWCPRCGTPHGAMCNSCRGHVQAQVAQAAASNTRPVEGR